MKQLRLGLVCYGGVSLAIYMHGQTKEMYKLARAAAYNRGVDLVLSDSENIYADVLKELDIDVVIDAISGTSAGGINGVALAKALADGGSLDALRAVWFDEISIQNMTNMPNWMPWWVIGTKELISTFGSGLKSAAFRAFSKKGVLDDTVIIKATHGALKSISDTGIGQPSIMPVGHRLDLAVNTTDYHGFPYYIPVADPPRNKPVYDLRYNVPLYFWHVELPGGKSVGNFDRKGMLTFACRSTSSFPGAFRPVRIADITEHAMDNDGSWIDDEHIEKDFFPFYKFAYYGKHLSTVEERSFVDGGTRDNKPFGHTIKFIMNRPADRAVVRRLLYLEPHPKDLGDKPKDKRPRLGPVIVKSMGLSGHEPIHRELWDLEEANRKVQRVQTYIRRAEAEILQTLAASGIDADGDPNQVRINVNAAANARGVGLGAYATYKLQGIPSGIAEAISRALNFPEQSSHAYFVRRVIWHHLVKRGWVNQPGTTPLIDGSLAGPSRDLLQALDIAYHIRRVRFVLLLVNDALSSAEGDVADSLSAIKASLWQVLTAYAGLADDFAGEAVGTLRELFAKKTLDELVRNGDTSAAEYADDIAGGLEGLLAQAMNTISASKAEIGVTFDAIIQELGTRGEVGGEIRMQAIAFPFWDRNLYPIMEASGLSDFEDIKVVRMSPFDSGQIMGYMGKKDKRIHGMKLGHFGAFMKRKWRESDYLWGRIDTVERLIDLLAEAAGRDGKTFKQQKIAAMTAVLDAEAPALPNAKTVIRQMRKQL